MNLLNLNKNDTLDLTKKEPELNNIVLACGWDIAKKGLFSFGVSDIDLDLSAFLLNENYKLIKNSYAHSILVELVAKIVSI